MIGPSKPVFVIAEAGINHNGSYTIAKRMVDAAKKDILKDEKLILRSARELVSIRSINKGRIFSKDTISTKKPATGPISASAYFQVIGRIAKRDIPYDRQISWRDVI